MDLSNNPSDIPAAPEAKSFFEEKLGKFNIWWLIGILGAIHLFVINFPNSQGQYVFDEAYYIPDAHNFMTGIASNLEHPFLGKAWIALGQVLAQALGGSWQNTFFPRLIEVGFGLGALYVFYLLALRWLTRNQSLFATALLGLDTLFFVHTSLALLDGPPLFFTFLGILFYFYWRDNLNENYLIYSGFAFSLAILSKETAALFVMVIAFYHLFSTKTFAEIHLKSMLRWFVIIVMIVIGALTVYDWVFHPIATFSNAGQVVLAYGWQNIQYMVSYQSALTLSTSMAGDPWHYALGWINPLTIAPDPYYVTTVTVGNTVVGHPIDWQGIGNLAVWYSIYPLCGYIGYKFLRKQRLTSLEILLASWIGIVYGANLYTSYIVHRIVYGFYMLDLTPALVLGIPLIINALIKNPYERRTMYLLFLIEAVIWFILFFPVHPWLF